jgi:hypothetical protein
MLFDIDTALVILGRRFTFLLFNLRPDYIIIFLRHEKNSRITDLLSHYIYLRQLTYSKLLLVLKSYPALLNSTLW